jgi:hypothetical protein
MPLPYFGIGKDASIKVSQPHALENAVGLIELMVK